MNKLLGKGFPQYSRKALRLSSYIDMAKLPPLPDEDDNYQKLSRMTMACNDKKSCCVVSGAVHIVQLWSSMAAKERIISDANLLKLYNKLSPTDSGLNVLEFLNYWRKNPIAGHPLGAFLSVNPTDMIAMKYGIHLFGAVFTGIGLPLSAQTQTVWDVTNGGPDSASYSWGGHLTICGQYDKSDNLYNYTWAEKIGMTPAFTKCYVDEVSVLLGVDWFKADHKSPDGFAWADLKSDLAKITKA